jgi:hypothetical protein
MSLEKVGVLVTGNQNTGQTQKNKIPFAATIQPAKRLLSDGYLIPTPAPHFAQLVSIAAPSPLSVATPLSGTHFALRRFAQLNKTRARGVNACPLLRHLVKITQQQPCNRRVISLCDVFSLFQRRVVHGHANRFHESILAADPRAFKARIRAVL